MIVLIKTTAHFVFCFLLAMVLIMIGNTLLVFGNKPMMIVGVLWVGILAIGRLIYFGMHKKGGWGS